MNRMKNIDLLKQASIDVDKGIELLGDQEMYDETLKDFLTESAERMKRIENAYKNKDMDSYAIDVHAMKGDANYLGFTKLAEMSLNHQLKSQAHDFAYIDNHYQELMDETNRIIQVVKEYLNC